MGGYPPLVIGDIEGAGLVKRAEVGGAGGDGRGFAHPADDRNEDAREHPDDRDDREQLGKRKAQTTGDSGMGVGRHRRGYATTCHTGSRDKPQGYACRLNYVPSVRPETPLRIASPKAPPKMTEAPKPCKRPPSRALPHWLEPHGPAPPPP